MFKIGDVVRLNRGWTPMIVLHVEEDGHVWACYASRQKYYAITRVHYDQWRNSYSYHRPASGFTAWDGPPINTEWNFIMPTRYRLIADNSVSGILQGSTSTGDLIIELDNGTIMTKSSDMLEMGIPFTFCAQSITNKSYKTHYTLSPGEKVALGDLLLSDSGNVYYVKAVDTKSSNPKGTFSGVRLLTQDL